MGRDTYRFHFHFPGGTHRHATGSSRQKTLSMIHGCYALSNFQSKNFKKGDRLIYSALNFSVTLLTMLSKRLKKNDHS